MRGFTFSEATSYYPLSLYSLCEYGERMNTLLILLAVYFWGGIPTAYIVARLLKGIDIRKVGTGNVGAANVVAHLGWKLGLGVGVFDGAMKGILPVLLAEFFGLASWLQVSLALCSVLVHNWYPYIKLTGGRGIAQIIGIYCGFGLWLEILTALVVACLIGWYFLRNLPMWTLFGLFATILVSIGLGQPQEIPVLLLGLTILTISKRLVSNWTKFPEGNSKWRILYLRLFYDRDIADRSIWVSGQLPME